MDTTAQEESAPAVSGGSKRRSAQVMLSAMDSTRMSQILARLRKHEDAFPFLKPVDVKKWNIPDYYEIIKDPMDLQTLGRQIRDSPITVEEFFKKLQLIWDNCRTYNSNDAEICRMADRMEAHTKELTAEIFSGEAPPAEGVATEEPESGGEQQRQSKRRRMAAASRRPSVGPTSQDEPGAAPVEKGGPVPAEGASSRRVNWEAKAQLVMKLVAELNKASEPDIAKWLHSLEQDAAGKKSLNECLTKQESGSGEGTVIVNMQKITNTDLKRFTNVLSGLRHSNALA